MQKIISFITTISMMFMMSAPAFAADLTAFPTRGGEGFRNSSRAAQIKEQVSQNQITRLQSRATVEIDRRVASLQKLITRINSLKRLNDSQKSSLVSQVQTEISNLQTLETKIKADTDLTTLRADVQSVVKSYRVYALFMPKLEIIAAADRLGNVSDNESTLSAKLQLRINTAKTSGNDTSALQTLLNDMNAKIADANTQATDAINAVVSLTPGGYPGNSSVLISARKMLQTGRQDLVAALQDAQKIRQGLRKFEKNTTGTGSATVTP